MRAPAPLKPIVWMANTKERLKAFPEDVCDAIGYALFFAQQGRKHASAKPLRGFEPGVMEIVSDLGGNAYRGVYTVQFRDHVYVLHVFQKKSKHGIAMPRQDHELIRTRLKRAQIMHSME